MSPRRPAAARAGVACFAALAALAAMPSPDAVAAPSPAPAPDAGLLQQERSILDALDDYVFQARRAEEALNAAEEARRLSERRLRDASEALVDARRREAGTRARLQATLRLARTTAPFGTGAALVLGGEDPTLTRRGALLARLTRRQGDELGQLARVVRDATVAEFVAGIERANAHAAARVERDARARLETETAARRALLARLDQDRVLNARRAQELTQSERELVREIESRLSDRPAPVRFDQLAGKVPLPLVDAAVTVPFGDIVHPTFGTRTPHPGLTLAYATTGTRNVRAVAFGRVAWIGRMRGFGTAIVLDHASGYFTVYAGMDTTAVAIGDVVRGGAVLGRVAAPPGERLATLHFELRQGSEAIDPTPFFAPGQLRRRP